MSRYAGGIELVQSAWKHAGQRFRMRGHPSVGTWVIRLITL